MKGKAYSVYFLFLFSFVLSVLLTCPVLADEGDAEVLTAEDMAGFEKLTFYNRKENNLIRSVPDHVLPSDDNAYSFLSEQVLVPTGSGSVQVEYEKIGRYKDREISVRLTFTGFELKDDEYKTRDGRYLAVPYSFTDVFFYDGDSLIEKAEFYYTDDPEKEAIDMTDAFLVINELNTDEYAGAASGEKIYLSEGSQLEKKTTGNGIVCYGNGPESLDDDSYDGSRARKYCSPEGVYYYDSRDCGIYHVNSVMFRLSGTANSIYIEDKKRGGGYGIKWTLDLNTLHIKYNIYTEVINGTISPSMNNIIYNSDRTVAYQPDENHILESVTVDGEAADITTYPEAYTFTNITQDHHISVVYLPPYKSITTEVVNGTITPSDYEAELGSEKEIVYSAEEGYLLDSIEVDGIKTDIREHGASFLFSNIQADHHIKVVYVKPDDPIKTVTDPSGRAIDRTFVTTGQEMIYSISFKNNTSVARTYTIKDTLPSGVEYVSADNGGVLSKGEIIWTVNASAGEEKKVSFRVKAVSEGSSCVNRAYVAVNGIESVTNKVENWVLEKPGKEVKQNGISIDGRNISGGELVTYYITVKNPASVNADIRITDSIPEYLEVKSVSNGGKKENKTLIWELLSVRANESITVSFTAEVQGGEDTREIKNTADVFFGDKHMKTNETLIKVPAVKKLTVLGEKKAPEEIIYETSDNTGVLGERKVGTGDSSKILVFILIAMCAAAGIEVIKMRQKHETR